MPAFFHLERNDKIEQMHNIVMHSRLFIKFQEIMILPYRRIKEKEKEKPVIEDIKIEQEKLAELNRILNSPYSQIMKTQALKKIAGGACCVCGGIPTKIVKYKSPDGTVIQRYCDACFNKSNLESES